jgi:tRNA1(Val) A37 N6-methylase TrmN6
MQVTMLHQSFEHFAQTEMSHEWNGKVSLVLTDPPYNTQRHSAIARGGHREISHDKLSDEQIKIAAELFERLLRPGGQCFIFLRIFTGLKVAGGPGKFGRRRITGTRQVSGGDLDKALCRDPERWISLGAKQLYRVCRACLQKNGQY